MVRQPDWQNCEIRNEAVVALMDAIRSELVSEIAGYMNNGVVKCGGMPIQDQEQAVAELKQDIRRWRISATEISKHKGEHNE